MMDYNITLRYICVSWCVFVGFGGIEGLGGSGTEDSTALDGGTRERNTALDKDRNI